MYLVRRIVVGVEMPSTRPWDAANLEAPTRLAVRQAFEISLISRIPVTLVSVLPRPNAGWFGSQEQAEGDHEIAREEALEVLHDLARQYTHLPDGQTGVECVISAGDPWFEILKVCKNLPDTMIICGTREDGTLRRAIFGSTGLKLLRNAAGPVWLVKPRLDEDDRLDILAATDLTEVGQEVVLTAVSLAKIVPSRVHILHVVDNSIDRFARRLNVSEAELSAQETQEMSNAENAVHEQLVGTDYRTLQPPGVKVHVTRGKPDLCILAAVQETRANVVIVASRARGGIVGSLMGNTAESLLAELDCSILVIKPDDFVSPIEVDTFA
ncbi:MAG: universal stress protein [Planctomyces sp.]|nr:universal stress protein [Planctomyces sp.]